MAAHRHQRVRNLLLPTFGQAVPPQLPHHPNGLPAITLGKDQACPGCGQPKTLTPGGDGWRCAVCWQRREAMRL